MKILVINTSHASDFKEKNIKSWLFKNVLFNPERPILHLVYFFMVLYKLCIFHTSVQ